MRAATNCTGFGVACQPSDVALAALAGKERGGTVSGLSTFVGSSSPVYSSGMSCKCGGFLGRIFPAICRRRSILSSLSGRSGAIRCFSFKVEDSLILAVDLLRDGAEQLQDLRDPGVD